ncbi:terpene synthase family protein [Streptomyces sp. NPDC001339]|uniref:terpene synthase family protein n=1 Tax=Streptomyces sp. NPDC001339 TaxID=3364563 RepID=UPI00369C979F
MLELPTFYMPFRDQGLNPAAGEAEAAMWAWLESNGLLPTPADRHRVERTRPASMYARWCPQAAPEVLSLLTQYLAWAFIVDDQFDIHAPDPHRCRDVITALDAVFDGPGHISGQPSGPLVEAFADLWQRLSAGRSAGWCQAFRADVRAWWCTYYREAVGSSTGQLPQLEEYRAHRREGVGLYMFMDISEIASGLDLAPEVRHLPAVRDLRDAAEEHMGLYNDIYSLPSDEAVGYLYNAVLLLEHHHQHPRRQAMRIVNDMLTACIHRMCAAQQRLPAELDAARITGQARADALRTTDDYLRYVRANFDYHHQTPRYTNPPERALEHGGVFTV